MKRSRGRNRRSGGNPQNAFNNPNRHYESVGPDVKIRGSAQQVLEKYLQYARDAQTSGDRILSEAYFQFAEHYQRIVAKQQEARTQQQQQHQPRGNNNRDDGGQRQGGEREMRQETSEDTGAAEDDAVEAEVTPATASRHSRDEDDEPDTFRVIDAVSDDEDDVPAERAAVPEEAEGEQDRSTSRRRKPYKARTREEKPEADAVPEIDGVMKTLSRGRRRPAAEEGAAAAETTD